MINIKQKLLHTYLWWFIFLDSDAPSYGLKCAKIWIIIIKVNQQTTQGDLCDEYILNGQHNSEIATKKLCNLMLNVYDANTQKKSLPQIVYLIIVA